MRSTYARAVSFALLAVSLYANATPLRADPQGDLKSLREKLKSLQSDLNETRGKRDHERDALQQEEQRMGELLRTVAALDTEYREAARALEHAQERLEAGKRSLESHRRALAQQVRGAYVTGRQGYLKVVLNQEDPSRVARMSQYFRYVNAARTVEVARAQAMIDELDALQIELAARSERLQALRKARAQEMARLEESRARRTALLATLERRVVDQTTELSRLKADEARLEKLLREIKRRVPEIGPLPGDARFTKLKGKLPLPLQGRLAARFGDPKAVGDLRWRGVFLAAPEGEAVHAVFRGRVAFADWLRGFGLLLILDHGDGYMTLYGHNQALYKQVGDWAEAGQAVAAVGNTGDAPQTGVYFEVRHNGVPHDPLQWCRSPEAGLARTRK